MDNIDNIINNNRINDYKQYCKDPNDYQNMYLLNFSLCSHMYIILGHFEIALRNLVSKQLNNHFKTNDYRGYLDRKSRLINWIKLKICKDYKAYSNKKLSLDVFISRQTFGYWSSILQNNKDIFKDCLNKSDIDTILRINKLRNRVMHFENIIKDIKSFDDTYYLIQFLLTKISNKDYVNWSYQNSGSVFELMQEIRKLHK